jgi:hypothetical protein
MVNPQFSLEGFTINSPNNRAGLSARLMRNIGSRKDIGDDFLNGKTMFPVSGVVHIPNITASANDVARDVYRNRIKTGVFNNGAVVASLHFDYSRFYSEGDRLYDNVTRRIEVDSPAVAGFSANAVIVSARPDPADHSVVIVGWDDEKEITYHIERTVGNETRSIPVTVEGAWRVYDNINNGQYWVSYENPLTSAYYIDGFYQSSGSKAATGVDFKPTTQRKDDEDEFVDKNPLEHTYEYDTNGFTGIVNLSNPVYANVFDSVNTVSTKMHAVSVFLTGDAPKANIYLIDDYRDTDSFDLSAANRIISDLSKPMPGYYTVKLPVPIPLSDKKFAVVVEVIGGGGSVPVQANTTSGNSFIYDGTKWTRLTSQVACIKVHAERDVDIDLEGLTILDSKGKPYNNTDNPFKVAPGSSTTVGPAMVPAGASDVFSGNAQLPSDIRWEMHWTYYERHFNTPSSTTSAHGFLKIREEDHPTDPDGYKKGDLIPLDATWLRWSTSWGMFIPPEYPYDMPATIGRIADHDKAWDPEITGTDKSFRHEDYAAQPLRLTNTTGFSTVLIASARREYYEPTNTTINIRVSTVRRERDDTRTFIPGAAGIIDKTCTHNPNDCSVDNLICDHIISFPIDVTIEVTGVHELDISAKDIAMRVGASTNLSVRQLKEDGKPVEAPFTVTWHVVRFLSQVANPNVSTGFADYNPLDPFNPLGPPALVDKDGRVTALRDGIVYVYATVGGQTSEPCLINITGQSATAVAVNKRRLTVSRDTVFTLTSNVRPASSTNKRAIWTTDNPGVVTVKAENAGIFEAVAPGVATVKVEIEGTAFTATSVITVTGGPSSTIRVGKAGNYSVLGSSSRDKVDWTISGPGIAPGSSPDKARPNLEDTKRGNGYRMTGKTAGTQLYTLTGKVIVEVNGTEYAVREQSWNIVVVVPVARVEIRRQGETTRAKKLTLGVNADGSGGEPITLTTAITKPATGATILGYEWTTRLDKEGNVLFANLNVPTPAARSICLFNSAAVSGDNNGTLTLTPIKAGKAKITATNYNGRKRASVSLRILVHPSASQIRPRSDAITLKVGKSTSVKARTTEKNLNTAFTYSLENAAGTSPLALTNSIVRLDIAKNRLTAVGAGSATLVITASGGEKLKVPITVE